MLRRLAVSNLVVALLAACVPALDERVGDCPCADGYVCSARGCVRPAEVPDGGVEPPDGGVDIVLDGGVDLDASTDSGTPEPPPPGPCDLCLPDQACFEDACVEYVDLGTVYNSSCAVMKRGKVACWGPRVSRTPWIVDNLDDAKEIVLGIGTHCAIREAGKVSCWTYYSDRENTTLRAEEVAFSGPVRALRPGAHSPGPFTCALLEDQSIECLGDNTIGQYGVPAASSTVAVTVHHSPPFQNPTHIFGLWSSTCVVHGLDSDLLSCFGADFPERVDARVGRVLAVGPHSERVLTDRGIYAVDYERSELRIVSEDVRRVVSLSRTCRVYEGGHLDCRSVQSHFAYLPLTFFGDYAPHGLRSTIRPSGVVETTVGSTQVCFRDEQARVYCLGYDQAGELGVGGSRPEQGRERLQNLSDVDGLIVGRDAACALTSGALLCWGYNADYIGRLGRWGGGLSPRHVPFEGRVLEASLFGDDRFRGGLAALLATPRGRRVQVYGPAPLAGQGAFHNPLIPRDVPALDGALHITSGADELCGAMPGGSIRCVNGQGVVELEALAGAWPIAIEKGGRYRLGVVNGRLRCAPRAGACPAGVDQIPNVVQVAAADDYGLALTATGEVHRFGAHTTWGAAPPVAMTHLGPVTRVSAYGGHACVLDESARVSCWGANDRGQAAPGVAVGQVGSATPHTLPERFSTIATGAQHTCALREGRASVECWGKNDFCELGRCDGYLYESPTPIAAPRYQRTPP